MRNVSMRKFLRAIQNMRGIGTGHGLTVSNASNVNMVSWITSSGSSTSSSTSGMPSSSPTPFQRNVNEHHQSNKGREAKSATDLLLSSSSSTSS